MRKLWLFVVVLSAAAASTESGAAQKPGVFVPIPLTVTIDGMEGTCGICGDEEGGNGTYMDGIDGVKANIDKYGNIIIDFQTTRAKMRGLRYNYQTATPPGDGSNHYFSTIPLAGPSPLQTMNIWDTIQVGSCPHYDDESGQPQYRHSFGRTCGSGLTISESGVPLIVTRTGPDTWEVAPDDTAASRVFSITTTGRARVVVYNGPDGGYYSLPFRMILAPRQ